MLAGWLVVVLVLVRPDPATPRQLSGTSAKSVVNKFSLEHFCACPV